MTTFSLQPWSRTLTEFAENHIEQWQASLVDQSTIFEDPHRIPVSLGLERRLEIIWAALVLPLLMKDSVDDRAPVLQNIDHLVQIYNTGIDLFSTETQQNLDKDDLLIKVLPLRMQIWCTIHHSSIVVLGTAYPWWISMKMVNWT